MIEINKKEINFAVILLNFHKKYSLLDSEVNSNP